MTNVNIPKIVEEFARYKKSKKCAPKDSGTCGSIKELELCLSRSGRQLEELRIAAKAYRANMAALRAALKK